MIYRRRLGAKSKVYCARLSLETGGTFIVTRVSVQIEVCKIRQTTAIGSSLFYQYIKPINSQCSGYQYAKYVCDAWIPIN